MSPPDPEHVFGLLVHFVRETNRIAENQMRRHEISSVQFFILKHLVKNGPVKQIALADLLGVSRANITQVIQKMERAGLVRRTPEEAAKIVAVSKEGERRQRELAPGLEAFFADRFKNVSATDLRSLERLLTRLTSED